jgi:hypothetical protein
LEGHGAYAVDSCAPAAYVAQEFESADTAKFNSNTWLQALQMKKNARKHSMSKKWPA